MPHPSKPPLACLALTALATSVSAQTPVLGELQTVVASGPLADEADDFGCSLSLDGDRLAVGAPGTDAGGELNTGAVTLLERGPSGWVDEVVVVSPEPEPSVEFGHAVALDGDWLAVGVPRQTNGTCCLSGAVFLFERSGGTWSFSQKITGHPEAVGGRFGQDVALEGNRLLVGADNTSGATSGLSGVAYVFELVGGVWTEQAFIESPESGNGADFGWSVALEGDRALIGAPNKSHSFGFSEAGVAYLFEFAGGSWLYQGRLTASDAAAGDHFGWDVALSGDRALIGAPDANHPGFASGGAYVFRPDLSTWVEEAALDAPQGTNSVGEFGYAVALDGDRALVGAQRYSYSSIGSDGSAFVFDRSGANWDLLFQVVPLELAWGDRFGWSVALDGGSLLAGAPFGDLGGYVTEFLIQECATVAASEVVRLGAPPNADALRPGLTTAPIVGAAWDPWIDHAGFVDDPLRDLLMISLLPANVPTALGTLLVDPGLEVIVRDISPFVPAFDVPIPGFCSLVGAAIHAQGATLDQSFVVHATNALDVTIGSI